MENASIICFNCNKSLPLKAKFCSYCLTQVRCKECNELIEKNAIGCIDCGTPIAIKNTTEQQTHQQFNTISITETTTERNIHASFSDNVGKELTGILRDAMGTQRIGIASTQQPSEVNNIEDAEYQEVKQATNGHELPKSVASNIPDNIATTSNDEEYPPLMTLAMRRLPATETEWVVLYGFFASDFGKKIFTRQDLTRMYEETRRKSPDKTNALTSNIKSAVQSGKFNAFSDGYSMLEPGIALAKEIMARTKPSLQSTRSKQAKEEKNDEEETASNAGRSKKATKSTDKSKRLADIDFYPTGKDNLKTYVGKFDAKSDFEKVLLFVSYFADILKIDGITYDHIYSCFDELGMKIPINVAQTTRNAASAKKWIDTSDSKNIAVTTAGKNKLRYWNKND